VRASAVAAAALGWALVTLGGQFRLSPPGLLYDAWYSWAPVLGCVGLAVVAGFVVGRFRVLAVTVVPVLVLAALQAAGHGSPWEDGGPPLSAWWRMRGWWPLLWALAVPLALGVVLRRGTAPDPPGAAAT
jgi:hypothetical protein